MRNTLTDSRRVNCIKFQPACNYNTVKLGYSCHYTIIKSNIFISHHLFTIIILIAWPFVTIIWERKRELYSSFCSLPVSLCSNTTNLKWLGKINLQPRFIVVFWTPSILLVKVKSSMPWPAIFWTRGSFHLCFMNFIFVSNSYWVIKTGVIHRTWIKPEKKEVRSHDLHHLQIITVCIRTFNTVCNMYINYSRNY